MSFSNCNQQELSLLLKCPQFQIGNLPDESTHSWGDGGVVLMDTYGDGTKMGLVIISPYTIATSHDSSRITADDHH